MPEGLSAAVAKARLAADGPNELRASDGLKVWRLLYGVFSEPLLALLFVSAGLYFWLGDRKEAIALIASALVAALITAYQQYRAERSLAALRDLASPRALVIRDGVQLRIVAREVVRGDCLVIREGDRVAADAVLIQARAVRTDESILTGESAAVDKFARSGELSSPQDTQAVQQSMVYANTLVVSGSGLSTVVETGNATQCGRIGVALQNIEVEKTPLQADVMQLAKRFAIAAGILCLVLTGVYALRFSDLIDGVLKGLTLAIAILPEELPLVVSVFLAIGAWRLSKLGVLTRHSSAIEALGAATVLCVDKTGTLTQNRMRIEKLLDVIRHDDSLVAHSVPAQAQSLVLTAAMACEPDAFDPMDLACIELARSQAMELPDQAHLLQKFELRQDRLLVAYLWHLPAAGGKLLVVKGAPEAVVARALLSQAQREEILATVRKMAASGLRLLAVARADASFAEPGAELPDTLALEFLGLLGFVDPLKASVPGAVALCRTAGVHVKMITGDFPETAVAVATRAGIADAPIVLTGAQLQTMDDKQLADSVHETHVFARVSPQQKLQIVQALKARGEVVAMTGDGVNDAPALKSAHIGVAMGKRGSDVAREASSLVLLDDDFASLVSSVKQGRRIFSNMRQAMIYLFAVHMPTIAVSIYPVVTGAASVLLPIHVMFLEFIIDPACSIVFEAEPARDNDMRQAPRSRGEPIVGWPQAKWALFLGLAASVAVLGMAWYVEGLGADESRVRTAVFTMIVLVNVALIVLARNAGRAAQPHQRTANSALWIVSCFALLALAIILANPFLRDIFRLAPPPLNDAVVLLAGCAVFIAGVSFAMRVTAYRRAVPALN
jgi:P-type Ca2+ transporter type 2C